jgi:hypothetical protein
VKWAQRRPRASAVSAALLARAGASAGVFVAPVLIGPVLIDPVLIGPASADPVMAATPKPKCSST